MKAAQLQAEIDRYARVYARWWRAETTERVYANARKRMARVVAEATGKRKAAKR